MKGKTDLETVGCDSTMPALGYLLETSDLRFCGSKLILTPPIWTWVGVYWLGCGKFKSVSLFFEGVKALRAQKIQRGYNAGRMPWSECESS